MLLYIHSIKKERMFLLKYQIIKNLHNRFDVFERNKLSPRAYAIPYKLAENLKAVSYDKERYSSDMVTVLSGEWDFKFYKTMGALPDRLNTIKVKFDKVTVPSVWQRTGHEEPVYLNCPYQFKTMAPEIPEDMPVGVYRKIFELSELSEKAIISFLGVANNLSLYVNGSFAGYSEGTHNSVEFDITPFLLQGSNELLVVSFKWCNGSFLESQDMFRDNGIFRDVLLYRYGNSFIRDFEVLTDKTENGYSLKLKTDIENGEGCFIKAELLDKTGKQIGAAQAENGGTADFGVLDVKEWNAELPELYSLYITLCGKNGDIHTIRSYTGFKTIKIENGVFRFNGAPIKCKGVNHHDTDLYKGYAMSLEDMERDVRLMKELNVNTVRTSHYPPDPYFITLADIYGLYIVDEADIETHGAWLMAHDYNIISHDLRWAKHYVDRVRRMYMRDRNHPSILMWSLGNESGGYKCHDKCYSYLKSTGTTIPVHYEGVVRTKRFHYDVISEMYTSTTDIEAMIAGKRRRSLEDGNPPRLCREYSKYPFYLCEYAHAMGVGPGNLEEYWDLFYEWDNSMGGCIWEWADHTVWHGEGDKKYKYRYTYGGDHGEKQHDGHFCVDGLMYADRRPHTGAREMKVVYRPLRATEAGNKIYCFENTNRFRSSDYIDINWVLTENGIKTDSGMLNVNLAPMQAECVKIDHRDFSPEKDCHISFIYKDRHSGAEIAVEQLTLNDVPFEYDIEIGSKISAETENGMLSVIFENGKAVFNGRSGELCSYEKDGKELLNISPDDDKGFNPNLFRALIDNDSANREKWINGGLDKLKKSLLDFNISLDDGEVSITAEYALKANKQTLYGFTLSYIISSFGAMEIKAALRVMSDSAVTDLPRFGLTAQLMHSFENVRYYGRGENENMPDFKCHAPVGIYSSKVSDMTEPYVYPQENGMHCDCKWIELSDDDGAILTLFADDSFNFSVHHYTQAALNKAAHQEDIKDMNTTFLTLDGYTRGIGSSSCGPDTRAEYVRSAAEGFELSFTLIPKKVL